MNWKDKLFAIGVAIILGISVLSVIGSYYIIWHFIHKFW